MTRALYKETEKYTDLLETYIKESKDKWEFPECIVEKVFVTVNLLGNRATQLVTTKYTYLDGRDTTYKCDIFSLKIHDDGTVSNLAVPRILFVSDSYYEITLKQKIFQKFIKGIYEAVALSFHYKHDDCMEALGERFDVILELREYISFAAHDFGVDIRELADILKDISIEIIENKPKP